MSSVHVCVPCSQISNRKVKVDFVFNLAREEKYRTEERLVGAVGVSGFKPDFMVMYACCYFQPSQKTYAGEFLYSGSPLSCIHRRHPSCFLTVFAQGRL